MARRTRSNTGTRGRCPSCGTPIHHHRPDNSVPYTVIADLTPLTPDQQAEVRDPDRRIYCHRPGHRLLFVFAWHRPDCPHPHVTEHRCTAEPSTLF